MGRHVAEVLDSQWRSLAATGSRSDYPLEPRTQWDLVLWHVSWQIPHMFRGVRARGSLMGFVLAGALPASVMAQPPPAQPGSPPATASSEAPPAGQPAPEDGAPPAAMGFQAHLRLGLRGPQGRATSAPEDKLSNRYSRQIFTFVDAGAKVTEDLYVGGYVGFATGEEGSDPRVESLCDPDITEGVTCSAEAYHLGIELQYSFRPDQRFNPWVGYGIGWEVATQSLRDSIGDRREESSVSGLELARIGLGADWRLGRAVGLGFFLEFALGRYTRKEASVNGKELGSGSIDDPTLHSWIGLGIRMAVMP